MKLRVALLSWLAILLLLLSSACDAATPKPAPTPEAPDFLRALASSDDYALLAGEGDELKYLIVADDAPIEGPCMFQNTERFQFHVQFLRTFPVYESLDIETYTALVLRRESRVYWGGTLKPWANAVHPVSNQRGVIAYSVYSEPGEAELPTIEELATIHAQWTGCVPYAHGLFVFVPDGIEQQLWVEAERAAIMAAGIPVLLPEELRPDLSAEVYSEGESYGYLRIVPEGTALDDYTPRDVVIVQSAPNDISVVSGLISESPQNLHSHVNLRLREKQTPNATVPDIYDNAFVASLNGHLVHVVARDNDVSIQAATLEDAEAYWDAHRPTLPALRSDLDVTALASIEDLSHDDAEAFGTKAANLGELHTVLDAAHRVDGFGIPFSAYATFIHDNDIAPLIETLLTDPTIAADRGSLETQLKAIRDAIRDGTVDGAFAENLRSTITDVFGAAGTTTRLRFRSSTNAEDLEVLSGAGLYDSKSGCMADDDDSDALGPSACLSSEDAAFYQAALMQARADLLADPERTWLSARIADLEQELSEEKSALAAIKKVWASLWTLRAFEERAYYGIDHRQVYMGIAVNPAFVGEKLDAVVVTNLALDGGDPTYRIVSQVAEVGVVQPEDPSAIAETLTFARGASDTLESLTILVESSYATSAGQSLWSTDQLDTLATLLFRVQDHFEQNVYPDARPLSLDLEVKLTRDDRISIKQARPYRQLSR